MANISLLERIAKLQAMATGAAQVGNMNESEAFAAKVAELLARHKLTMTEVEIAAQEQDDPMGSEKVDPNGQWKNRRSAWQEKLAMAVSRAFFCKIFVISGSDRIGFVGRETDRKMAVWVFMNLVRQAQEQADREYVRFFHKCSREGQVWKARGFRATFLTSFVAAIAQRYAADRQKMAGESQHALVRINQALEQTQQFMNTTMKLGKGTALQGNTGYNAAGWAKGAAAGNAANIKANAVNGSGQAVKALRA